MERKNESERSENMERKERCFVDGRVWVPVGPFLVPDPFF